jgi:D-sedoheptulose 7-phosphate isomerase
MVDLITERFRESSELKLRVADEFAPLVEEAVREVVRRLGAGGTIYLCGNGGSAADAQHLAGELAGRFYLERDALAAVALGANVSTLTAVANDYSFDEAFSRPLSGLARAGDVLIGLSTSGDSTNVVMALRVGREKGLYCIGLTGADGGSMRALCDVCFCVPSQDTPRVQEVHITVGHIMCELIEARMASGS